MRDGSAGLRALFGVGQALEDGFDALEVVEGLVGVRDDGGHRLVDREKSRVRDVHPD